MNDANAFVWRMCNDATNFAIDAIDTAANSIWSSLRVCGNPNPDANNAERDYYYDEPRRMMLTVAVNREAGYQIWRSMEMLGRPDGDYAECMNEVAK